MCFYWYWAELINQRLEPSSSHLESAQPNFTSGPWHFICLAHSSLCSGSIDASFLEAENTDHEFEFIL